jgi:hypothetical protein
MFSKKEHFEDGNDDNDYNDDKYLDKLFDRMSKNMKQPVVSSIESDESNGEDDKYFSETQFHNDYRDTITAFGNVAPAQKQLFNRSNFPVKFVNPKLSEVKELVRGFIKEVNKSVKNNVPDVMNSNSGWDEMMPEQNVKSGWDKQQEELGLPCSIYNEPAKKGKVKLIKVDHIEKYATEEQIRYVTYLILQKVKVKDQMLVRVSFVLDNLIDERQFFTDSDRKGHKSTVTVNIEEIFILGYLTDAKMGAKGKKDDFYNFEGVEKDGMMDQAEILRQLNQKYKDRQQNASTFDVTDPIMGTSPEVINNLAIDRLTHKFQSL